MQAPGDVPPPAGDSVPRAGGAEPAPAPAEAPKPQADPHAGPPPELGPTGEEPGFFERVFKARATTAFLIAVLAIFCLMWRDPSTVTVKSWFGLDVYLKYGGFDTKLLQGGDWWRLLSALFVPRSAIDAFVYLFIFFQMGPALERILGTVRFCVLYLGAGAAGIAMSAMLEPNQMIYGTMLVVYAVLGGIPGTIWGYTGSFSRMVKDPGARSSAFFLLFWIGIGWFSNAIGEVRGGVTAAAVAFIFGWALGGYKRGGGKAMLKAAFPLILVLVMCGMSASGYRWFEGKFQVLKPGGVGPTDPDDPDDPDDPRGDDDTRKDMANSEARAMREELEPRLDLYGKLPSGDGQLPNVEYDGIRGWLFDLNEKVDGDNAILGELDDLRVRCMILLGRHSEAADLSEQYLALKPSPQARALAGVALFFQAGETGNTDQAKRYLEDALQEPGLDVELPEARYYLGVILYYRHEDAASAEQFKAYLKLVGEDESAQPKYRRGLVAQAKAQLGR